MIQLNGINWIVYKGVLVPDAPPHVNIKVSTEEARYLLKQSGAYFIRYTDNYDCGYTTEFWYVIKDSKCSMEELSRNTRNQVRKGLENCVVEKVNAEFIANYGYEVYRKSFKRYKNSAIIERQEEFKRRTLNLKDNPNREFWAVFEKKTKDLIAYSHTLVQDNMCGYLMIRSDPDYLRLYPNYALLFKMNQYYLNELGLAYVSDGTRNLAHATNIQDFLIQKFKFRKAYCRLNIIYSKKVELAIRLLFPFRGFIHRINHPILQEISIALRSEEIRRSFI
jgi:hypothetical protein